MELFDEKQLVYLTADSENTLHDLLPNDIYIIGGIVDHNRYKQLTFNKAEGQKIRHGKLPIREFVDLDSSAVLTVNHVFDIIARFLECRDWKTALEGAIPERKRKVKDETKPEETKTSGFFI